uniref:Uncharacterized protein n=1 Tax=Oryza brachyantha TaxID=4533 RepID=J3M4V2_ORYBR
MAVIKRSCSSLNSPRIVLAFDVDDDKATKRNINNTILVRMLEAMAEDKRDIYGLSRLIKEH